MGFSSQPIVIDGKGHLLGRLATVVAKNILQGQKIVVVRAEEISISGNFHRSKLKFLSFLRKRCNVKPSRGSFHYRAPSRIFWRVVRGMVPHKTARGMNGLRKLRVYEGVPSPYDKGTKKVVPCALKHLCLRPRRKSCKLSRLSAEMGWKYEGIVSKLEDKRKVNSAAYYERKKALNKLRAKALKSAEKKIAPHQKVIAAYGYA